MPVSTAAGVGAFSAACSTNGGCNHMQPGLEKITDGGPPDHGRGTLLRALSLEARSKEHMLFIGI